MLNDSEKLKLKQAGCVSSDEFQDAKYKLPVGEVVILYSQCRDYKFNNGKAYIGFRAILWNGVNDPENFFWNVKSLSEPVILCSDFGNHKHPFDDLLKMKEWASNKLKGLK